MALSVLPVDGLINRLIDQHQRPSGGSRSTRPTYRTADQVSISSQARAHADSGEALHEQQASRLEDQLLQMYTRSGRHK